MFYSVSFLPQNYSVFQLYFMNKKKILYYYIYNVIHRVNITSKVHNICEFNMNCIVLIISYVSSKPFVELCY